MKKTTTIEDTETEVEVPEPEVQGLTTSDIATMFGTDTKTLRRFLRSELEADSLPGKGNRYRIPDAQLEELKRRFEAKGSRRVTEVKLKNEAEAPAED